MTKETSIPTLGRAEKTARVGWLLLTMLSLLLTVATAASVADFLALLFGRTPLPTAADTPLAQLQRLVYVELLRQGPRAALWYYAVLMLALYGAKNVASYLAALCGARVRIGWVAAWRKKIHGSLMQMKIGHPKSPDRGDWLSRFGNDLVEYDETTLAGRQTMVASIMAMVVYLAMMAWTSPRLTMAALLLMPGVAAGISMLGRRLKRSSETVQTLHAQLMAQLQQTMEGAKEIKAYGAQAVMRSRYAERSEKYRKSRTAMFRRSYAASPISDTLGNALMVVLLLMGAALMQAEVPTLTPDGMTTFLLMAVLLLPPLREIGTARASLRRGKAMEQRLKEVVALAESQGEETTSREGKLLSEGGVTMRVSHLTFGYGEKKVLDDVSFDWKPGETMAVVGPSGSGKTTLLRLLMRHYEPSGGTITADGTPLSEVDEKQWRRKVAWVPQETKLLSDTLRNNIRFYRPTLDEEGWEELLRSTTLDKVMPEGMRDESRLGPKGMALSGGERQRVAWARALYTKPDLLLLDEATASLDSLTEEQLVETLRAEKGSTMRLLVAHRLSTVRHADQILYMEQGRIIERGTHEELMQRGGRYAAHWKLQAAGA